MRAGACKSLGVGSRLYRNGRKWSGHEARPSSFISNGFEELKLLMPNSLAFKP